MVFRGQLLGRSSIANFPERQVTVLGERIVAGAEQLHLDFSQCLAGAQVALPHWAVLVEVGDAGYVHSLSDGRTILFV